MPNRFRRCGAAVLLGASLVCSASEAPRIKETTIIRHTLRIEFDRPMLTWRGASDTALITLSPQVNCSWYWEDDSTLACGAQSGETGAFRAATAYQLQIPRGLWSQQGVALEPIQRSVISARPELTAKVIDWHAGQPEILIIGEEMPFTASEVSRVLALRLNGEPVDYSLERPTPKQLASAYIHDTASTFVAVPTPWPTTRGTLVVSVREGLRSSAGPVTGNAGTLLQTAVNEAPRLVSLRCDWQRLALLDEINKTANAKCDPDAEVTMVFNRRLARGEAERIALGIPGLTLAEQSAYAYWGCEYDAPCFGVLFDATAAGTRLTLKLPADLRAEDGALLAPARVPDLIFGDYPSSVQSTPSLRLLRPGEDAVLALALRNLAKPPTLAMLSTDTDSRRRETRLPVTPRNNRLEPWQTRAPRALSQNGGLMLAGMRDGSDDGFALAVAPFNVIASADSARVMVWATDWDSAGATVDASIELLEVSMSGREKVLARGRTGADGVGYVSTPTPTGVTSPIPTHLLRVRYAGKQSVIPVLSYWSQLSMEGIPQDEQAGYYNPSNDTSPLGFGVSERLLYRPGDTVHFRLWSRQRDGNRLRQTQGAVGDATALVLSKDFHGAPIDSWSESRDRWGSVSGKRVLSEALADGDYCITHAEQPMMSIDEEGACFQVARFDSQAIWAQSRFDRKLVRNGEPLALAVEGGFYSGGAAVGALVEVSAIVAPTEFNQIYPAFARFEFTRARGSDDEQSEVDPLATFELEDRLDAIGKAQIHGRLPQQFFHSNGHEPVAIGEIRSNVSLTIPGSPSSSSPLASVVYAAHARYVGLHAERGWLSANADPVLEAVIVSAEGVALEQGSVAVRIERDGEADAEVLARCNLAVGKALPCPFRAPAYGRYRIIAEADGAAAVALTRYFYAPDSAQQSAIPPKVELSLLTPPKADQVAVLRLQQPLPRANALFVIEYDKVLRHWVEEVGQDTQIRVAIPPEWAPGVSVRVLLRAVADKAANRPLDPTTPSAVVRIPVAPAKMAEVGITLTPGRRAPGEEQLLTLHNPTATPRLVTMAIVDDSVHQQAVAMHELIDPAGPVFLGRLAGWSGANWHGYGEWQSMPNLFRNLQEDGEQLDLRLAAGYKVVSEVSIVGSRLTPSSSFNNSPDTSAPPRAIAAAAGPLAPRVRSRFPENAYWNPGEVLAPGETRTLQVRLPDNLTRWRLLAWSSDDGDRFSLIEQTFEATLPLEIRAGLPTRLFAGDQGSGTVLARVNAPNAAIVNLDVHTQGSGADGNVNARGLVAAQASLSRRVPLRPDAGGQIALLAQAATGNSTDALSSSVEVRSRLATVSTVQTGWLEGGPLKLSPPLIPAGAVRAMLNVTVAQGTDTWRDAWLRDLREYPHRCWEQTLSRGLGAALALQTAQTAAAWPQAQAVLDSTLRDAPTFRDAEGFFRYFADGSDSARPKIDPVLSAYTLRGFQILADLGHKVPALLREDLRRQLGEFAALDPKESRSDAAQAEKLAIAIGALAVDGQVVPEGIVPRLWPQRAQMSWFGRTELLRAAAMQPQHATLTAAGLRELRAAGTQRGFRRVLNETRDWTALMGSPLRDQCAITATLFALDPSPEHRAVDQQWLRGLHDLYAGGTESLDTQASVQCLLALRAAGLALGEGGDARVAVTLGKATTELKLNTDAPSAHWETPVAGASELVLNPVGASKSTLNYSAEVRYVMDQRNAVAQATGMQLTRSIQVLRDGEWRALGERAINEGEWLRTTLSLVVPEMRYFVAITDTVPGGLVTRDVRLGGVAGERLQQLADPGAWWFDSRQTGATEVRFYAQQLPPGTHQLHYYSQATHAGRYFAPPAVAELMYGRNSRATSAPQAVEIKPRG